jgi:hypothetical protein
MGLEISLEQRTSLRFYSIARPALVPRHKAWGHPRIEPEERDHFRQNSQRIRKKASSVDHKHLLCWEVGAPAGQLLVVDSAAKIGVLPVNETYRVWIGEKALLLSAKPLWLSGDRILKRKGLTPEPSVVLIV